MEFTDVLYHVEEGIATITLNRPDQFNAFSLDMLKGWAYYLEKARDDDQVEVIVVTGNGKAFCAGGDVKTMNKGEGFIAGVVPESDGAPRGLQVKNSLMKIVHRVALTLEDIDKPVICAVNGPAMGAGLDMALMCDIRIASEKSVFAESYIKVGIVPGDGGAYYLPRLVGLAKALEMLWFGDRIDAEEALRIGLVNKVVPAEDLLKETMAYAKRLVESPTIAIRMTKRAVYSALKTDLRTALDMVSSHMAIVTESADHKEAVQGFIEKRPPNFKGK